MEALCDVNLLLALITDRHEHHTAAVRWVDGRETGEAGICRVVQLGVLRLLNNPAVMKEDVLDTDACWAIWSQLLSDDRFRFVPTEPPGLDGAFAQFTAGTAYTPRLWTDAYLAAYALASDRVLVTFDNDFGRFPGLRHKILGQ